MVYLYTSKNVKIIKDILTDFYNSSDTSPCEYMKCYIESWDDPTDDSKLCWIVETFLGIMKHDQFLKQTVDQFPSELNDDDKDYLLIILHGLIFQLQSSDMNLLYKCLFNLRKNVLNALTSSLKTLDFLDQISKIAQPIYDTNYITEHIIGPLSNWQHAMDKMAQMYAEYLTKIESLKVKPPTIPIQPNVLTRKNKRSEGSAPQKISIPATPPNSVCEKARRMLTKSVIDKKLKQAFDNNKQKAMKILNEIKSEMYHYPQKRHFEKPKQCINLQNDPEQDWKKPFSKSNHRNWKKTSSMPVKENIATLKRYNERMKLTEREEIQWLQDLLRDCRSLSKFHELEEYDREERERERILDIEKKHIQGQISFEEALLAKKKVHDENKKKYEDFMKEKELWNKELEKWNQEQIEINRKHFEKLSLIELNVLEARKNVTKKKKEEADLIKKENETLQLQSLQAKQEELKRKIQMIKEIKILSIIAKRAKLPKIIDLTETSGIGLLCEMSMVELQERLSSMKMNLKEELEAKSKFIKEQHVAAKKSLEDTRKKVADYLDERKKLRKSNKKTPKPSIDVSTKEINDLKMVLEAKRKLRQQLT
ncbi:uncharacterized protein LOC106708801 [Papilio machaon]|uniref:uncharacterized protein LOC106708801 n=1 Tax=Papilio machaon TaxID=76193 RepID=UPI001E664421|nr:uncharacterized protein LOC106708801 [Papilio machaon]